MIVGLTGGIGSGKSTIAKLFEIFGCIIFDSDSVAKQLYFDPIIKSHIIKLLGEERKNTSHQLYFQIQINSSN